MSLELNIFYLARVLALYIFKSIIKDRVFL
jgi:hypothetical protein